MNGLFNALFMDLSEVLWCLQLFIYDLAIGSCSHIDVDLPRPSRLQYNSQLVVVSGRLFIVEYTRILAGSFDPPTKWELQFTSEELEMKNLIDVNIWEIVLTTKEVVKVAEMAKFSKYEEKWLK